MEIVKVGLKIAVLGICCMTFSCAADGWDKSERNKLIERCRLEGGSKSYCKCYLSNAMEKFPNAADVENIDFETAVELSIDCE